MEALNEWSNAYLGTWVTDFAPIILIIAVALAVILLVTFIICALCHAHNIKKFRKLKEENGSAPADEEAVRESIEAKVRAEYESAATDNSAQYIERIDAMTARIDELTYSDREKQSRIDELTAELDRARSSSGMGNADAENSARIVELDRMLNEKQNEINLLKAENSQIKAQALQQQLAVQQSAAQQTAKKPAAKSEQQPQRSASAKTAKTAKQVEQPQYEETVPASEDEYDEYYDDYGDATSEVKVTVKFDRIKNSWVILRSDTDRAYRRLATKQEALGIAKDLARRLHAQLVVHKKDGKFQKV